MLITAVFPLLALASTVRCAWPFDTSFLAWVWQSAVVVDHWLYIDGGEQYTLDNNSVTSQPLAATLAIDLSQPWTIDSVSALNDSNTSPPLVRRPQLWYDPLNNLVMRRGGWDYDTATNDLWSFSPDGQGGAVWSLNGSASQSASQLSSTFGGAFTTSTTTLYSLGGAALSIDNGVVLGTAFEGLTTYDFLTDTWKNSSSFGWSESGYAVQSQAVLIPNFGHAGLVAFLGGDAPSNQSYEYEAGAALVDMSDITIYDTADDNWYHQTATGSVPPPRSEFCAVGSASKDNSSYEIYVFGGSTNYTFDESHANDTGYLDVFILSMPSFVWFKAGSTTEVRRSNHFCQIIGEAQMLVIGGRDPTHDSSTVSPDGFSNFVDPWHRGMNIFDMNSLNWTDSYSPNITYDRPPVVQQYYATHDNQTSWSNVSLANVFSMKPSTTSGTNNTSSAPAPHSSHPGAIAGGVIGGLAGIAIILLSALYLVRRRRRYRMPPSELLPSELPPDEYKASPSQRHEMEAPPAELPGGSNVHEKSAEQRELLEEERPESR